MCTGCCAVDVPPSPKVHDHCVGIPPEESRKGTRSGLGPRGSPAAKRAVGGLGAVPPSASWWWPYSRRAWLLASTTRPVLPSTGCLVEVGSQKAGPEGSLSTGVPRPPTNASASMDELF